MELSEFKYPIEQKGVLDDFYREIFFEKEYDRYGAKVEEGDVVIDFGAFVGMFSHFALNMPDKTMCKVRKWAIEFHLDWVNDGNKWSHGADFDGHKTSKLLFIMEKFTRNGFSLAYEQIHKKYNIVMLYAWR